MKNIFLKMYISCICWDGNYVALLSHLGAITNAPEPANTTIVENNPPE